MDEFIGYAWFIFFIIVVLVVCDAILEFTRSLWSCDEDDEVVRDSVRKTLKDLKDE